MSGNDQLYAATANATALPPQTQQTIGDLLTAKSVSWKWYRGAWAEALSDGIHDPSAPRTVIYAANSSGTATQRRSTSRRMPT